MLCVSARNPTDLVEFLFTNEHFLQAVIYRNQREKPLRRCRPRVWGKLRMIDAIEDPPLIAKVPGHGAVAAEYAAFG